MSQNMIAIPSTPARKGSGRVSTRNDGSSASENGDGAIPSPTDRVLTNKLSKLAINKKSVSNRYSPPFVRNGGKKCVDDPFIPKTPSTRRKTGRAAKSDNWRSGSSSDSGSESESKSLSGRQALHDAQHGDGIFVQEYSSETGDMSVTEAVDITADDAQAVYPPSACVFVANLLKSEDDDVLEAEVLRHFREYGIVYVKVRRDHNQMPFAFCQYTNDEDAQRAVEFGRGHLIKGRPCRTEKAKAHRLFFIERKFGAVLTPSEARQLLSEFGTLNICRPVSVTERNAYDLGEGVMVHFDMYDNGKAALQFYQTHDTKYHMLSMAHMGLTPSPSRVHHSGVVSSAQEYKREYELDTRSIFIGNLAQDILESDLRNLCTGFGSIASVSIHRSTSNIDGQIRCFAFVEFTRQPSVPTAINDLNGSEFHGKTLRVSQKDTDGNRIKKRLRSGVSVRTPARNVQPNVAASNTGGVQFGSSTPVAYAQGNNVPAASAPQQGSQLPYAYPTAPFGFQGYHPQYYPDYAAYWNAWAAANHIYTPPTPPVWASHYGLYAQYGAPPAFPQLTAINTTENAETGENVTAPTVGGTGYSVDVESTHDSEQ